MGKIRVGVLGGTFNPVHVGHLELAIQASKLFGLVRVHFVVATVPPHKDAAELPAFPHRYAMVCLATASNPSFIPSIAELDPPASPYSIDTLRKIARAEVRAPADLYFIAGSDSLAEVGGWRSGPDLLASFRFVFASRPGVPAVRPVDVLPPSAVLRTRDLRGLRNRRLAAAARREAEKPHAGVFLFDAELPDISSSDIRMRAAAGKRFGRMVPAVVHDYIQKTRIYGER